MRPEWSRRSAPVFNTGRKRPVRRLHLMDITLRLSDGHSFAVEFTAANESGFRVALANALSEYYKTQQQAPELHVCTDIRQEWIPPNYPESNAPLVIRKMPDRKTSSDYWAKSVNALLNGNYFDEKLAAVIRCATADMRAVDLTVIDGGKK